MGDALPSAGETEKGMDVSPHPETAYKMHRDPQVWGCPDPREPRKLFRGGRPDPSVGRREGGQERPGQETRQYILNHPDPRLVRPGREPAMNSLPQANVELC